MNYKNFIILLLAHSPTAVMANNNKNGKDLCNYCSPVRRWNQSPKGIYQFGVRKAL